MLEKKYYDGMQIHDVLCECLDDYDTILTILEKFASLPSAIKAERKTEPQTDCADTNLSGKPTGSTRSKMEQVETEPQTDMILCPIMSDDDSHLAEIFKEQAEMSETQTDCAWK